MKLSFYGADQEVTGSCHCLEVGGKKLLVDCGMQQGGDAPDDQALPYNPGLIDAVLVTHAHIDHSGRLPLLVKGGYSGPIYATRATCELLNIMLMDSARIQESDAQWRAKRKRRSGEDVPEPMYTSEDAQAALTLLHPLEYGQQTEVLPGVTAVFYDAGHLLGSACIRLSLQEGAESRTIIFSGDIGTPGRPIIRDPQPLPGADYVVTESTYGDRLHEQDNDTDAHMASIIDATLARGGNVVIPSFAVGRTQELLYRIREIKEQHLVKSVPDFPVWVDSPLALEATQIYSGDLRGYADEETIQVLKNGFQPLSFSNLHLSRSADESMALNTDTTPKVIISSSGMCEAGRIRHHLKHNLWRPECTVMFVGYQAQNSLGSQLLDGVKSVKLVGETIAVRAQIANFRSMSGHADQKGLLDWITALSPRPGKTFVVHGEESAALTYTQLLRDRGFDAVCPNYESAYDLLTGQCLEEGVTREALLQQRGVRRGPAAFSPFFRRLVQAGEHLMDVIRGNEGGANKDLAKFTDQINSLADKWKR